MSQTQLQTRIEDLKHIVSQLSQQDLLILLADIQEQLQTFEMMSIAESGFQEWHDPEEDIYNA